MKNITGLKKDLVLLTNSRSRALRALPLGVQWYLKNTFNNEKLTQINDKYVVNTFMPPFPGRAFEQLMKNTVAVYKHELFPYSAYLAITNKCRFNCWHCSRAHRKGEELDKEKWIEVVGKLQDIGISIISRRIGSYAHSNLIEVLSSSGAIGFILYYSIYLTIILKLLQQFKFELNNRLKPIWYSTTTTIVVMMFYELFSVTYYGKEFWIVLSIVLASVTVLQRNNL